MRKNKLKSEDDDLVIIDLDKEDISALDESNEPKLGSLDKYISATYLWMHMVAITVYTALLMVCITFIPQRYMWHIFMIGSFVFMSMLWGVYILSKKMKEKRNKKALHKVKFIWQVIYVALSLIWMCVVSMICGIAQVAIFMNNIG